MKAKRSLLAVVAVVTVLGMLLLDPVPSGALVAGANGRVAFVSNRDGDNEIFVTRGDGTGVIQVTFNPANDYDPAVSANGRQIAFISDRSGTTELYTMNLDGTGVKKITKNGNGIIESHPSWSPNNLNIAFAGKAGTDSDIWTAKPSGGGLVDLTPDAVEYDANPTWAPGGFDIAFDRSDPSSGTNIYVMKNDGTQITPLTSTGKDSHPSYGPNKSDLFVFESGRDNPTPGPSFFASIKKPDGVAVTASSVLVTQLNTSTVRAIDSNGAVTDFGTLPVSATIEKYIAVSPGLGGFPAGNVYVMVNNGVYVFPPTGGTATLFTTLPQILNGNNGITFDTVGTFSFQMIVVDHRGHVVTVDSTGASVQIANLHTQLEGPAVAPLSFEPYGGYLLATDEFTNEGTMWAINPTDFTASTVGNWGTAEGVDIIPSSVCNFGTSTGAWFVAMEDSNQILKFPASDFAGLEQRALTPSEMNTDIGLFTSDGGSVTVSTFHGPIGTPEVEGSDFAPCPPGGSGPVAAPLAPDTQEIYKMNTDGSGQTRLTNNTTQDLRPAFSPDATKIVFASDRDDPNQPSCEDAGTCTFDLFTMNADGTDQNNITINTPGWTDTSPDWQSVAVSVSVQDFSFTPVTANGKLGVLGETIQWDFFGPTEHTATDNSGMGLFDSGIRLADQFYYFTFFGAGRYPYICTIHPFMTGTVKVPINVSPSSGGLTTPFTVTWASSSPPAGYVYDVQILRPGSSEFADWRTGVTITNDTFLPDAGVGQYQFQARVRNTTPDPDAQSNYSTPKTITVS